MSKLTRYNKNKIECNVGHCPRDCNTCGIFNDIRKKLLYYEYLEEQGFKMVNTDKIIEQLEEESWSVGCSFAPKENRTAIIKTEKAIEIVKEGAK